MITGLGVISPVGDGTDAFWESLLTGRSATAEVSSFDASAFPVHVGCEVRGPGLESSRQPQPGRASLLAAAAGRQALAQAGLSGAALADVPLCVGTTMGESCWLEAWKPADVRAGPAAVPAQELVRSGPDQVGRDIAAELSLGGRVT
ncbi:MAG TPA: beta-ketoacyl synthase N-terminal-like domain-containing protein, partial [Gaiellaceae bacterium]